MTSAFTCIVSDEGIANLRFDLPDEKVNTFSLPTLEELEGHLSRLAANPAVKALTLTSGKPESFIAGANLHTFRPAFEDSAEAEVIIRTGHRVFSKLQSLPFPSVAVIHGTCLGGGLECALSCTYRLVSDHPKTALALPEVNLGIYPGWGGTQRLPRLVGLTQALQMILTGKSVDAVKAWKMHLADAVVAWEFLPDQTTTFVQQILSKSGKNQVEQRRKKRLLAHKLMENNPLGRAFLFWQAKRSILKKTKGHYPSPLLALELIKRTHSLPLKEGLKEEADTFVANVPDGFTLAKDLITLFFTQEAAKKATGVTKAVQPTPIEGAAVIGAGTMGAGIGWLLADHGILTRLKDISWDLVGKGIGTVKSLLDKGVKARKRNRYECDRRFQLVSGTVDYSGFQRVSLVIEAATENLELKKKILQEIEEVVRPDAIIASNTSSLTIEEMGQGMKHPERFIGMHFFNPVHKMPLVEIVGSAKSSPEAIATAFDLCKKLGKVPLLVGDCPGFLVNRTFMPGANEVLLMLEEGYSMDDVEKALLDFGMPMGPFVLADEIGNDVTYKVSQTFEKAYGMRMRPAKLMQLMMEKGLFGHKNGKGFYLYNGEKRTINPEIKKLLRSIGRTQPFLHQDDIVPRFLYGMVNEAARCLQENVVSRADFIDLALITGIGFPPFRGGLLRYADKMGVANVVSTLKRFERELGPRFEPCQLLEQKARHGQSFYS